MVACLLFISISLFQSFVEYKTPRSTMDKMKEDTRNCNLHPAHPVVTWVHPILGNSCHRSRGLIFGQGHGFPIQREGNSGTCLLGRLSPGPGCLRDQAASGVGLPPEPGCLPSRAASRVGLSPEPGCLSNRLPPQPAFLSSSYCRRRSASPIRPSPNSGPLCSKC